MEIHTSPKLEIPRWSKSSITAANKAMSIGSVAELSAGSGAIAHGIRVDPLTIQEPDRLNSALKILDHPLTVPAMTMFTVGLKDAKAFAELSIGHPLPYGGVLDGFMIVASTIDFWQAMSQKKGAITITLAGAQVVARVADLLMGTTQTKMIMIGVDALSKANATWVMGNFIWHSIYGTPLGGGSSHSIVAPMVGLPGISGGSPSPAVNGWPNNIPLSAVFHEPRLSAAASAKPPHQTYPDTVLVGLRAEFAGMPSLAAAAASDPSASQVPRPSTSKLKTRRKTHRPDAGISLD